MKGCSHEMVLTSSSREDDKEVYCVLVVLKMKLISDKYITIWNLNKSSETKLAQSGAYSEKQ